MWFFKFVFLRGGWFYTCMWVSIIGNLNWVWRPRNVLTFPFYCPFLNDGITEMMNKGEQKREEGGGDKRAAQRGRPKDR